MRQRKLAWEEASQPKREAEFPQMTERVQRWEKMRRGAWEESPERRERWETEAKWGERVPMRERFPDFILCLAIIIIIMSLYYMSMIRGPYVYLSALCLLSIIILYYYYLFRRSYYYYSCLRAWERASREKRVHPKSARSWVFIIFMSMMFKRVNERGEKRVVSEAGERAKRCRPVCLYVYYFFFFFFFFFINCSPEECSALSKSRKECLFWEEKACPVMSPDCSCKRVQHLQRCLLMSNYPYYPYCWYYYYYAVPLRWCHYFIIIIIIIFIIFTCHYCPSIIIIFRFSLLFSLLLFSLRLLSVQRGGVLCSWENLCLQEERIGPPAMNGRHLPTSWERESQKWERKSERERGPKERERAIILRLLLSCPSKRETLRFESSGENVPV